MTITDTKSSCGCVVPALAKKTYDPGEGGEITATFKIGDPTGEQKKEIRVLTDDPKSNRRLTIAVTIPEFATITPGFVHWTLPLNVRVSNLNYIEKIHSTKLSGRFITL